MKADFWDERYGADEFAYGDQPNDFVREVVDQLPKGKALCLAAGEGRNAVFLAQHLGPVTAVDQSAVGLEKARQLATACDVNLTTEIADLGEYSLGNNWSVITSIWAHVPAPLRAKILAQVEGALAPDGVFVLESYTPAQVGRGTGGPPEPSLTTTLEELRTALPGLEFEIARECEREVHEGRYHTGSSAVVQLLARKK